MWDWKFPPESISNNSPVLAHMTVHSCGYLVDSNWVWFLRKTGFRLQNVSVHLVIGDIYCLLTNNIKIINIKVRLTNVNKDGQVKVNWKSEIFATQKFEISGPTTALERIWAIISKSGRTEVRRLLGIKDFYMTVHFHPFSEWHFENFLKFGLNSYVASIYFISVRLTGSSHTAWSVQLTRTADELESILGCTWVGHLPSCF